MASNSGTSKRSPKSDEPESDDCDSKNGASCSGDSSNGKRMKKDNSENHAKADNDISEGNENGASGSNLEQPNEPDENRRRRECSTSSRNPESSSAIEFEQGESSRMIIGGQSVEYRRTRFPGMVKYHRHISSSSDDDEDTDSEKVKKANKKDIKKEVKNYDPTPNTPFPKHKWNVTKSVISREYGWGSRYSADTFRYNCYSSLHMVERLELMYKMKKHDGCVNALNFNSRGTRLVSGSDDLNVVIWDWFMADPVVYYRSGHQANVFQAKFMPLSNDMYIVTCARDGQIRLGELSSAGTCKSTRKLAQHKGSAHKLSLQMDSPHCFLTCGEDSAVFSIDLREDKPNKLLQCKSGEKKVPLYTIFVNPQKSYEFAVGGRSQYVKLYDSRFLSTSDVSLKDFCPEHLLSDEKVNVTSLVYNYNGQEILASYNDEDIYTFNSKETDTKKFAHRYRGHRNNQTVKGVNYFGPKSEYILSGSDCGCIFFWDKESEHIVNYMYGDEGGAVNCLEPNPVMPILATSGLDDDIKLWVPSCENAPDLARLKAHITKNMRERAEDNDREYPDAFVDQTIWFLMQHLSRSRRRRQTESTSGREESDDSSTASSDEMEVSGMSAPQCNQS